MDIGRIFSRAFGILTLNQEVMKETADDPNSTVPALIFVAIGGFLAPLAGFDIFSAAFWWLVALVFSFVYVGLATWLAGLLGGESDLMRLYRVFGHAYLLQWLAGICIVGGCIGLFSGLYLLVVSIIAISALTGLDGLRASVAGIVPVIVVVGLCICTVFALASLGLGVGIGIDQLQEALNQAR